MQIETHVSDNRVWQGIAVVVLRKKNRITLDRTSNSAGKYLSSLQLLRCMLSSACFSGLFVDIPLHGEAVLMNRSENGVIGFLDLSAIFIYLFIYLFILRFILSYETGTTSIAWAQLCRLFR
jgi:hypothetical protein